MPLNLDYFEEAIDILLSMEEIQKEMGVGLMGISKAGDIALSLTAFLPHGKIAATVAINCMANSLVTDVVYKQKPVLKGMI